MRTLGLDFGARRLGVAISDASGVLARPLSTIARPAGSGADQAIGAVLALVHELEREGEPVTAIVVGWPRRLDGTATAQTQQVEQFAAQLQQRSARPVHLQDERLSSREAESRLALRERDWRRRKIRLDAASAAVILQDFLDGRRPQPAAIAGLPDACAD